MNLNRGRYKALFFTVLIVGIFIFILNIKLDNFNENTKNAGTNSKQKDSKYQELLDAGYSKVENTKFIKKLESYLSDTNIDTDDVYAKQSDNEDGSSTVEVAVGDNGTSQLLMKLTGKSENLKSLNKDSTEEEIKAVLNDSKDDKYELAMYTADGVKVNAQDISNIYANVTFTIKSLLSGTYDVEVIDSENGCSAGNIDVSGNSEENFTETTSECSKITNGETITNYIKGVFDLN